MVQHILKNGRSEKPRNFLLGKIILQKAERPKGKPSQYHELGKLLINGHKKFWRNLQPIRMHKFYVEFVDDRNGWSTSFSEIKQPGKTYD